MNLKEIKERLTKGTNIYSEIFASSTIGSIKEYIPSDFYDLNRIATGNLFNLIPRGKIICLAAPEGTGKTIILMNIIKHAQKMDYKIIANETEGAWDKEWCQRWGVDVNTILYNYTNTIEDFRIQAENFENILIKDKNKTKFFWCLDSLGGMTLRKASENKAGKVYIDQGLLQRHIKEAFKAIHRITTLYQVPFVFTNHLTANPNAGMYAQTEQMVGGKYPRHAAWMIFYLSKTLKRNNDKNIIGQLISVKSMKNRSMPPFQTGVIDLDYRKGANIYAGLADLALDFGLFGKSGNYYVVPNNINEPLEYDEKGRCTNGRKLYGIQIMKQAEEIFTKEFLDILNHKLSNEGYYSIDDDLKEIMEIEKEEGKENEN